MRPTPLPPSCPPACSSPAGGAVCGLLQCGGHLRLPPEVAATVGKGIVRAGVVDHPRGVRRLIGAITWNVITWWYGIPSSSSHALIGGIVGRGDRQGGRQRAGVRRHLKTVAFIFVSPLLGFLLGSLMMVVVAWLFRRTGRSKVDKWFRRLQLVSAGAYSLGHGGNDAQKTIGIIWMLLIATGYSAAAGQVAAHLGDLGLLHAAIGAGTMFGGWRIVKTMGQRITKLKPVGGFCAETGGALTCSWPPRWAFRCRPRTPSPAPSSGVGSVRKPQCRALGRGRQHRLGLDLHDSRERLCRRHCLLDQPEALLAGIRRCSYACPQVTDEGGGRQCIDSVAIGKSCAPRRSGARSSVES
jgi:hypothetical protein